MFQTDQATAAASLPTPSSAGTQGYFTNGNPASGVAATILDADFMNMIMMELVNVVAAGGLTPSKTTYTQVRDSIKQLILGSAGVAPVVGTVRNLAMSVATASANATVTADEIIVESALGGLTYKLASFSKTINLATTGAGAMDTGTAPASNFVGIYAIYNPTTGVSALLGVSANGIKLPEVYGGANMPSGYTASALLTVVPTNASSQIAPCMVMDRSVDISGGTILSTATTAASATIINNLLVPFNAKTCSGFMQLGNSAAASMSFSLCSSSAGTNQQVVALTLTASGSIAAPFNKLKLTVAQRAYYMASSSAGTPSFSAQVTSYEI
jgi:hypothetical protein